MTFANLQTWITQQNQTVQIVALIILVVNTGESYLTIQN